MSRPPKPVSVLKGEGKSHRTKKELRQRESAEQALLTGVNIKESAAVKNNVVAHAEFKRVLTLLKKINKSDALYQTVINRYCLMVAECDELEQRKVTLLYAIADLQALFEETIDDYEEGDRLEFIVRFSTEMGKLNGLVVSIDKQLQTKRKMLLDIEKENVMTIASALRSIPKQSEDKPSALLQVLQSD